MKPRTLMLLVLLAGVALAGGCMKKVDLTITNHGDAALALQLSTPDETMSIGSVGPGGKLSTVLSLKKDDLPAQCRLAAGSAEQSFMVTEDSPAKWWFRITKEGKVAGPYGKDDVHMETQETMKATIPMGQKMIVK